MLTITDKETLEMAFLVVTPLEKGWSCISMLEWRNFLLNFAPSFIEFFQSNLTTNYLEGATSYEETATRETDPEPS